MSPMPTARRARNRVAARATVTGYLLSPDRRGAMTDIDRLCLLRLLRSRRPRPSDVKAVNRLQAADAVLFDDLSVRPDPWPCPRRGRSGRGRQTGRARLAEAGPVSRLLVDYALTGARVVRLKSGDCGIFGRLEEEIDRLPRRRHRLRDHPRRHLGLCRRRRCRHPADPPPDRPAGAVHHRRMT